jgi:hypothetical protein
LFFVGWVLFALLYIGVHFIFLLLSWVFLFKNSEFQYLGCMPRIINNIKERNKTEAQERRIRRRRRSH